MIVVENNMHSGPGVFDSLRLCLKVSPINSYISRIYNFPSKMENEIWPPLAPLHPSHTQCECNFWRPFFTVHRDVPTVSFRDFSVSDRISSVSPTFGLYTLNGKWSWSNMHHCSDAFSSLHCCITGCCSNQLPLTTSFDEFDFVQISLTGSVGYRQGSWSFCSNPFINSSQKSKSAFESIHKSLTEIEKC